MPDERHRVAHGILIAQHQGKRRVSEHVGEENVAATQHWRVGLSSGTKLSLGRRSGGQLPIARVPRIAVTSTIHSAVIVDQLDREELATPVFHGGRTRQSVVATELSG